MSTYRVAYGVMERERAVAAQTAAILAERTPCLRSLAARRNARMAAGIVGIFGAFTTATSLVFERFSALPTELLAGSVAASVATYALMRLVPGWLPREWPRVARSFERFEAWSLALPLVAASLLGPLTLHGLVYTLLAAMGPGTGALEDFSKWMVLSGAIVGHAHLALAILAATFARKLAQTPTENLGTDAIRKSWVPALWITVAVAAVPGVLLIAIPPILTLVTGLVLIPAMYLIATKTLVREREARDEADDAITSVRVGIEELEAARDELYEPLTAARSSA